MNFGQNIRVRCKSNILLPSTFKMILEFNTLVFYKIRYRLLAGRNSTLTEVWDTFVTCHSYPDLGYE